MLVFVDTSGSFTKDTECVNGVRGNAADHLTKDVVPYVISHFGVSSDPANWGVAGWSMGGTCAVTLTAKYPELFSTFVGIDGDVSPNAGSKDQTVFRLFGGDEQAWESFDPTTVMNAHGPYTGVAGWFSVSDPNVPTVYRDGTVGVGAPTGPSPGGPFRGGQLLVCGRQQQRHRVFGGGGADQARLAIRGPAVRQRAAVARREDRYSRRSADTAPRCHRGPAAERVRWLAAQRIGCP